MRRVAYTLLLAWAAGACGCTWVPLTEAGSEVHAVANPEVLGCERVGTTKARVLPKLWFIPRQHAVVEAELETLARNEAAKLEGNTVTGLPSRTPGEREFAVYRCYD